MSETGTTQNEPWTILRMLQWTTEHLKKHGSPSARLDAEVLFAHARKCKRIDLYAAFNEEPPEEVKAVFRELVKRRAAGEPVAYLVGQKEFYSLSFVVDKRCLIPRGETEHIVIECLDRLKKLHTPNPDTTPIQIVDVCTGSGCIAVTIAKEAHRISKPVEVTAIDLSPDALAVARQNVELHQVQNNVSCVEADLLSNVATNSCDFVLSNPPYVSLAEFEKLDKSVRDFEPRLALVSGEQGTEVIQRLIAQSAQCLKPGGWLIFELSPMIFPDCRTALESSGNWQDVRQVKDLAGLPRVLVAQKPNPSSPSPS